MKKGYTKKRKLGPVWYTRSNTCFQFLNNITVKVWMSAKIRTRRRRQVQARRRQMQVLKSRVSSGREAEEWNRVLED